MIITMKWLIIGIAVIVFAVLIVRRLCNSSTFIPPRCDHSQIASRRPVLSEDGRWLQATSGKQRGVCWEADRGKPSASGYFSFLTRNNIEWISLTPFAGQSRHNKPEIAVKTENGLLPCTIWGETDEGIRLTTQYARQHGIKALLKPHLWLRDGRARQELAMENERSWQQWFRNYEGFILHYAQLAQSNQIPVFCIGTELRQAAKRTDDWLRLIGCIRQVYSGLLIYAANWDREYEEIQFWDHLDYIGIQAYFPLTSKDNPTVEDLVSGWQPHAQAIERVQARFNKPVIFTEIGYRNTSDTAVEPWIWPQYDFNPNLSFDTQTHAFEAFFRVFWHKPWFNGVYIWKWRPIDIDQTDVEEQSRQRATVVQLSPQFTPALRVIKRWYGAQ